MCPEYAKHTQNQAPKLKRSWIFLSLILCIANCNCEMFIFKAGEHWKWFQICGLAPGVELTPSAAQANFLSLTTIHTKTAQNSKNLENTGNNAIYTYSKSKGPPGPTSSLRHFRPLDMWPMQQWLNSVFNSLYIRPCCQDLKISIFQYCHIVSKVRPKL